MDESKWRASVESWLGVEIAEWERIGVGHSRAMIAFATTQGEKFMLRVEQGGVFGTSSASELEVMRAIHDVGFPVAAIRWADTSGEILGQPAFVMEFVEGESGRPEKMDRPLLAEFVRTLHRLHSIDTSDPRLAALPSDDPIDHWWHVYRDAEAGPVPLLDEARAWLHRHRPPLDRPRVVHGDPGPGNFVYTGHEVRAVTDWEFCHLGDPNEDWAFLAGMRGARNLDLAGWATLVRETVGVDPSPAEWTYWLAFNLFKGSCANLTTGRTFMNGTNPAPNMLAIGTALHSVFLQRLAGIVGAGAPR